MPTTATGPVKCWCRRLSPLWLSGEIVPGADHSFWLLFQRL